MIMTKTIIQVDAEITAIIRDNHCLTDRVNALEAAGYADIVYVYVKNKSVNHKGGIGSLFYLPKKKMYRIQIDNTPVLVGGSDTLVDGIHDGNQ